MSLSSLKRFLPAAPPRHVVLLSDTLFFMRSVPVTEGATGAEVATQAELAVEALAPFPLAQLYYGHLWLPGAAHVLVYAAYRKRFTADEVETWAGAEAVLPAFVTVVNKAGAPSPATAMIVPGAAGLTGLYFGDASGVPTQVRVVPWTAEATDADRLAARDAVLAAFREKYHVIECGAEPAFDPASPEGEFVFRAGERETHLDAGDIAPLDVRDKGELAARRRAQARDVILWRVFLGSVAALGLALLLEGALVGAALWQQRRLALEARQRPVVEGIMTSQTLATRIDELSTKRLLPFEMLALVNTVRPPTIQFLRVVATGLLTMDVEAQTTSPGDIDVFRSALNALEGCDKAEVLDQRSRADNSTFRLVITFEADAFVPGDGSGDEPAEEPSEPETEERPGATEVSAPPMTETEQAESEDDT